MLCLLMLTFVECVACREPDACFLSHFCTVRPACSKHLHRVTEDFVLQSINSAKPCSWNDAKHVCTCTPIPAQSLYRLAHS